MPSVSLRPATPADGDFLLRVYASTRAQELAAVPWTDEQKRAFVAMQFEAQSRAYSQYETAVQSIIVADGADAGRLYVARWPKEIRIMDISLLPEFRGRGIGTGLLRELLGEATAGGKRVTIHVERFNPALRLYQRLGFRSIEEGPIYLQLEWRPD